MWSLNGGLYNDLEKKERSLKFQGIMNIFETESINSEESSLKSCPLWETLYSNMIFLNHADSHIYLCPGNL